MQIYIPVTVIQTKPVDMQTETTRHSCIHPDNITTNKEIILTEQKDGSQSSDETSRIDCLFTQNDENEEEIKVRKSITTADAKSLFRERHFNTQTLHQHPNSNIKQTLQSRPKTHKKQEFPKKIPCKMIKQKPANKLSSIFEFDFPKNRSNENQTRSPSLGISRLFQNKRSSRLPSPKHSYRSSSSREKPQFSCRSKQSEVLEESSKNINANMETHSDINPNEDELCKICLQSHHSDEGQSGNYLIQVCLCSDYIHLRCLEEWITRRDIINSEVRPDQCEVCKQEYKNVHISLEEYFSCTALQQSFYKHPKRVFLQLIPSVLVTVFALTITTLLFLLVQESREGGGSIEAWMGMPFGTCLVILLFLDLVICALLGLTLHTWLEEVALDFQYVIKFSPK